MGFDANLPWQSFVSSNVYYGSGIHNGLRHPDAQLSPMPTSRAHTDRSFARKGISAKSYSVAVNALNIANRHVLIDNSLTFGGFHYNDPREIYVEFRYKFHY